VKIYAMVQTTFAGSHCWPTAPEGKHVHLRNPHRHLFHVKLLIQQFHDDRDIEFLDFKDRLDAFLKTFPFFLGHKSCEMMATEIGKWAKSDAERSVKVEVWEDGENGALIEME
jgi:hypothetical protein